MGRKITILGMGPTAHERRVDILRYVEGTEIWGLNNGYVTYPHLAGHWSRWFELHKWSYLKTWNPGHDGCHFALIDQLDVPVMVSQPIPIVRNQMIYKFQEVFEHFESNYFLGSPSLMLALALYEHDKGHKVDEVRSWGIDTSDPTHAQQRQSWAWWLRAAHERGIKLAGSSTNFMAEAEIDGGLIGIREDVGDLIVMKQQESDSIATTPKTAEE